MLIRRKNEPYQGALALPGGFVEKDETVEQAVVRETREETGLDAEIVRLIGVYSDPGRDPRGPTVSVCYLMRPTGGSLAAASDASDAVAVSADEIPALAFDHDRMIRDGKPFFFEARAHRGARETIAGSSNYGFSVGRSGDKSFITTALWYL